MIKEIIQNANDGVTKHQNVTHVTSEETTKIEDDDEEMLKLSLLIFFDFLKDNNFNFHDDQIDKMVMQLKDEGPVKNIMYRANATIEILTLLVRHFFCIAIKDQRLIRKKLKKLSILLVNSSLDIDKEFKIMDSLVDSMAL